MSHTFVNTLHPERQMYMPTENFVTLQGHSHQVWSGQVCTVVRVERTLYGRGVWGHAPPEIF